MNALIQTLSASLIGCGIAAAVARYFIIRAFDDLRACTDRVTKIDKKLAIVLVRLEKIAEHEAMLREHERRIYRIEDAAK